MPEQSQPLSDPRVFAATGLDRLGATPLRGADPQQVGPFRIVALIGSGGMGRIYLGRDLNGGPQLAAVKVIRPEYAEDAQFRRRFEREADALARVQGGQTAVLLGRGFDQDLLWMATEYIPGLSLSATVADHGTLDLAAAWRLAADLGRAVQAMQRADVVHRDIKPSNVILGPDGCRLIDFGISQAGDTSSITVTGQQVGTPAYMSPEQVRGLAVATSSDVFALGSVLAYALTGNAPFGDGTSVDVLHRVAFDPPREDVLERVAAADRELAELVRACLAKDPQQRPTPDTVVGIAAHRQAAAPWSTALYQEIMTRIQVASVVSQLPLGPASAPVRETVVLSRREPAAGAAAGPGPTATPVAPAFAQQPYPQAFPQQQQQQQQPTPPYLLHTAAEPERRSGRRTGLLVSAAVLAVAVVAATVVLLARSSGDHAAAASGTVGTVAPTASLGQGGAAPTGSGPASPSPSASAPASPSAPGKPTGRARPSADPTASATASHPAGSPPHPAPTTAGPTTPATSAPPAPAVPAWIKNCTYYSGSAETQLNDTGPAVLEIQCILVYRGYNVVDGIDGQFGKNTEKAVEAFQEAKRLEVDGQVGPQTWPALRSSS